MNRRGNWSRARYRTSSDVKVTKRHHKHGALAWISVKQCFFTRSLQSKLYLYSSSQICSPLTSFFNFQSPLNRLSLRSIYYRKFFNMASTKDLSVSNLFSLKDYVCLVTGGGTGIGLMATQVLAANGDLPSFLSNLFSTHSSEQVPKYTSQADAKKSSKTPQKSTVLILKSPPVKSSQSARTSAPKSPSKISSRRSLRKTNICPSSSLPPASQAPKGSPTPDPLAS